MLKYQQDRQNSAQTNAGCGNGGPDSSAPKLNSVMNGESLEDIRKVRGHSGSRLTLTCMYMDTNAMEAISKCVNAPCSALCTQIIFYKSNLCVFFFSEFFS